MRGRWRHTVALALAVMAALGQAAPPGWPAGPRFITASGADIPALIARLGAGDFAAREEAAALLREVGPEVLPALVAAQYSDDPEIQVRARALLNQRLLFIPPWMPTQYRDALLNPPMDPLTAQTFEWLHVFNRVAPVDERASPMLAAATLARRPLGDEPFEQLVRMRGLLRAREMIASGDVAGAKSLLRGYLPEMLNSPMGVAPQLDYAALVALSGGARFDPHRALAELAANGLGEYERYVIGLHLYRAAGDVPGAAAFVTRNGWWTAAVEAGDYAGVVRSRLNVPALNGSMAAARAYRVLGNVPQAQRIEEELLTNQLARPWAVQSLAAEYILNDRVEEALRIEAPSAVAGEILCRRLDVKAALDAWAGKSPTAGICRALVNAGLYAPARPLLKRLAASDEAKEWRGSFANGVAILMQRAGLADEAQNLMARAVYGWAHYSTADEATFATPGEAASAMSQAETRFWLAESFAMRPVTDRGRWERLARVRTGKLSPADADTLASDVLEATNGKPLVGQLPRILWAGDALHRQRQDVAAAWLAQEWERRENDPSADSILGDIALDAGDPAAAVTLYQRAAFFRRTDPVLMYRTAIAMTRVREMRSMGAALLTWVPLLVLGDHTAALAVGAQVRRMEGPAAAEAWLDTMARRFGREEPAEMAALFRGYERKAEAAGDWPAALALQTQLRFLGDPADPDAIEHATQIMGDYHRVRAISALRRRDWTDTEKALTRMMDYAAPDVALLELTIPALNTADPAAARRVLAVARGRLQAVAAQYPEATRYVGELKRLDALRG